MSIEKSQMRVTTIEGGSANISCHVDSNPPASISWRHLNSGQTVSYSSQLHLPSISRVKAGRYVCEVEMKTRVFKMAMTIKQELLSSQKRQ